jgi:hypothetical protein
MNQKPKFEPFCSNHEAVSFQAMPSVLTFEMPIDEEIAKAIWQRQHDRLTSDAIFYNAKWRDPSVPFQFWDEFLLDARAVLSLLCKKHIEYQNNDKSNGIALGSTPFAHE